MAYGITWINTSIGIIDAERIYQVYWKTIATVLIVVMDNDNTYQFEGDEF